MQLQTPNFLSEYGQSASFSFSIMRQRRRQCKLQKNGNTTEASRDKREVSRDKRKYTKTILKKTS